jgi:hypothetical protein
MKNTTISLIRIAVPFSVRQCYFGLLILFAFMAAPKGYGQITLIDPATEGGFENGTTFAANGWTAVNPAAGTRSWQIGTGQAGYTGARAAFIGNDATTVGTTTASRTVHLYRSVTIPAGAENIQLTFKYKQPVSDYVAPNFYDYIAVYTNPAAPTSGNLPTGTPHFGPYPTADVPNFTTQAVTLPNSLAGTTTNLIFTFKADGVAAHGYGAVDDISLTYTIPPCASPGGLGSSAVMANSATISWSPAATAPANGYEYYYSTSSTAPTGATVPSGTVGAGITTASISGLTSNSTYYFWVRSNCGGTDGVSSWSASSTFLTPCDSFPVPFLEAFSTGTIPSCWATTSSNTVPNGLWKFAGAVDYDNGNTRPDGTFAWVDGSDPSTISDVTLLSPNINLAGLTVPELVFDYFSNNEQTYPNNIFKVDVFNGTTWTNVYTNNTSSPTWRTINISLAAYTGTTIKLRFVVDKTAAPVGWAFYNDILLDNVIVQETPACPPPTGVSASTASLTGGNVTWTAPSSAPANGYEYYYSTTNTAPTAATPALGTVAAGVTNATITGLTTNTTYYVWVRSACNATTTSPWVGPGSFFAGYCTPAPVSQDGTGITNVTLGTINNTTGTETGFYGDYSAMTTNAAVGSTINLSISFNTCDAFGCYTYGTKIWIDFNDDADFNDAGELVYTGLSGNVTPIVLTGSFNISPTAALGSHRMRIGATDTDTGPANACYTGTYGVFEDYTINIFMPPAPVVTGFTPATVCAATGDITITGTDLGNATALTIGGTAVTISTNTNTQITATVPAGVSGVVAVTTVAGTSTTVGTFAVSTPPAITLSAAGDAICAGGTTDSVTIATGAAAYDTFMWAPATGVSGTAATGYTFNPTATTTYTLTASNTVSGCVTTATFNVTVNALPTALVMDDAAAICEGGAAVAVSIQGGVTLGTILTENFNAATNSWLTVNNSTGGTPANSAWTLRPDGYEIPGYDEFVFSNDNTQFYLSNSDSQGSGSTTSVILRSPAFSTVGYTSANINFYHFYMQWQTSTAKVEASINGTDWTTLQTYNSDQGEYGIFESENIALTAAFLNQPTVYIRFKFDAVWGYFWGIDNVSVSGQQTGAVTWAPMTGLYIDAAATTAYTGQPATTVYARPTATTTYVATATNPAGCMVTDQIVVNYTSTPVPTVDNDVQIFCNAGTVGELMANGTAIQWYTSPSGGQALDPAMALEEGVTLFYGSQTVNGCESVQRVAVAALVNVHNAPVAVQSEQTFCAGSGATIGNLSVLGDDITWYADDTTTTPLSDDTVLESGVTYYASQTINGCESSQRVAVTAMFNVTDAPMADAEQFFCNEGTVGGLSADGENVQWYADATGGTALADDTALADGVVYHASQTIDGCEATQRTAVTAYITEITEPMGEEIQVVEENVQGTATIADIDVTGDNMVWYASEADALAGENPLDETELLVSGTTYYVTQTIGSCTSTPLGVTVTVQLGRNNFDAAAFRYYPNPVKDVLNLSYSADITSVTVYNLLGQQVLSKELNATAGTVDMSALQDGTYLVNVTSGDSVEIIKVIKKQ